MSRKRRWLWVVLFIGVAVLLSILATGWNLVLVRDYQHILSLAKKLSQKTDTVPHSTNLIFKMLVGTLGFVATLTLTILLFIKLLREMGLNQLQSDFLATVSHELKTPLTAIELSSSLLRTEGLSSQEIQELWNSHYTELDRLKKEVNTLLEAARWQSRPFLGTKTRIDLESWIKQSFSYWQKILGPESSLLREGAPLKVEILGDLKSLNLITDNLLTNAKNFSKGHPHVVIRSEMIPQKGIFSRTRWQLHFIDFGWGFDPADSQKIFNRFFRSRTPAPYAIPGSGLGLYLASSASRAMGLTLRGRSEGLGAGACFTLEGQAH